MYIDSVMQDYDYERSEDFEGCVGGGTAELNTAGTMVERWTDANALYPGVWRMGKVLILLGLGLLWEALIFFFPQDYNI